jgi:hypothetical protein
MKPLSALLLSCFVVLSSSRAADDRPTINSLAGHYFRIEDDGPNQELTFRLKGDSLVAVWRILGSGVPVISEVEYPVDLPSKWQARSEAKLRDGSTGKLKVSLYGAKDIRIFLNGVQVISEEISWTEPHLPASPPQPQPIRLTPQ